MEEFVHLRQLNLWWHFALTGDAPRFLRALVGTTTLLLLFAGAKLLRPLRQIPGLPRAAEIEKAKAVIATSVETFANLALLGDKTLLFNDSGTAFIMYAVEGRSWVALGDPIGGPRREQQELIDLQRVPDDGRHRRYLARIRRDEPRPEEARLPLRRLDDMLRVHAGRRHGERPCGDMLPLRRGVIEPATSMRLRIARDTSLMMWA